MYNYLKSHEEEMLLLLDSEAGVYFNVGLIEGGSVVNTIAHGIQRLTNGKRI